MGPGASCAIAHQAGTTFREIHSYLRRASASPRREAPEFLQENVRPRERARGYPKRGAGNAGRAVRPQPRVRMVVVDAHEYSQQSHRNRPAFPHAMVLTVSFVLSPAIGFLATVISRIKVLSGPVEPNAPPQDLTPASRRQDHTTSPSADSHLCQSPRRGLPRRSFSEGGRNSIVVLRA